MNNTLQDFFYPQKLNQNSYQEISRTTNDFQFKFANQDYYLIKNKEQSKGLQKSLYNANTKPSEKRALIASSMTASCFMGLASAIPPEFCWRKSYIPDCEEGLYHEGALCYKPCKDGWDEVAHVCWKRCEEGWTNMGATCLQNCQEGYSDIGLICKRQIKPWYAFWQPAWWRSRHKKTYAKESYINPPYTHFSNKVVCNKGFSHYGALCIADCSKLLVSCGLGACAASVQLCAFNIGLMIAEVIEAAVQIALLIVSGGSSLSYSVVQKQVSNFFKNMAKKIVAKIAYKQVRKKLKQNFQSWVQMATKKAISKLKPYFFEGFSYSALTYACQIAGKQMIASQQPSFEDLKSLDFTNIINTSISCSEDMSQSKNKLTCAKEVLNSIDLIDPTGLTSAVASFMHPMCHENSNFNDINQENPNCIQIYSDFNFKGDSQYFCETQINDLEKFNNNIGSFLFPNEYDIFIAFSQKNFQGISQIFQGSESSLINKKIQSLSKYTNNPQNINDVAKQKKAWQSSTSENYEANFATKGMLDGKIENLFCSMTLKEYEPYWMVDLEKEYEIDSVIIKNREDCCWERLNNYKVFVGNNRNDIKANTACPGIHNGGGIIKCQGLKGQYLGIQIQQKNEILTICGLQVYPMKYEIINDHNAQDIEIGASGDIYTVQNDGNIHKYDIQKKLWTLLYQKQINRFAVGPNGSLYYITKDNLIFKDQKQLPHTGIDITIGTNGILYILGPNQQLFDQDDQIVDPEGNYAIFKWNNENWEQIQGAAIKIATEPDGCLWIIQKNGKIYKVDKIKNEWIQVEGFASDISIGADGSVYILGNEKQESGGYKVFKWRAQQWDEVQGAEFINIAVDKDGIIWGINKDNKIIKQI